MKKNIIFTLQISLSFLILTSCKKEEDPIPPTPKGKIELLFSKSALTYVNIPVGKYFIYQDSATSILDSVVVIENKFSMVHHRYVPGSIGWTWISPSSPEYSGEKFEIRLASWKNGFFNDWLKASAEMINYQWWVSSSYDTGAVNLKDSKSYIFSHTHTGTTTYSVSIDGRTYTDINITYNNNGYDKTNPLYYESTYYWAKGIGVIKRTIKEGTKPEQTVYLVRHN